jgi:hypothetical protein
VLRNAPQGRNIQNRVPRPYDLHSAQIRRSDDLDNARAKINAFWHKRLQCKSYQRRDADHLAQRRSVEL